MMTFIDFCTQIFVTVAFFFTIPILIAFVGMYFAMDAGRNFINFIIDFFRK